MKVQKNKSDLIEGGIVQSMLVFAIPLLIGNLFQQLYNTADSYVVGNFVDTNALARSEHLRPSSICWWDFLGTFRRRPVL